MATETREIAPATPLPWRLVADEEYGLNDIRAECDDRLVIDADCDDADAAYIVHAANCYPDLLAALKDIDALLGDAGLAAHNAPAAHRIATEAIAKAEGR